jgi:hypothetical protein
MICLNRAGVIISASIAFSVVVEAAQILRRSRLDWKKERNTKPSICGTEQSRHGRKLTLLWHSGDVTIYFSALKADGVTQQSRFGLCNAGELIQAHRLTLDGYTFYNSNKTTPKLVANPDNDIAHAYLNGKVFKIVGANRQWCDGSGLDTGGWKRFCEQQCGQFIAALNHILPHRITSLEWERTGLYWYQQEPADRLVSRYMHTVLCEAEQYHIRGFESPEQRTFASEVTT